MDGVILTRNVEPGEFVQPGAAVITMANLKELTITVYVPEDRYGEISLGQSATVTVALWPSEIYSLHLLYFGSSRIHAPQRPDRAGTQRHGLRRETGSQ